MQFLQLTINLFYTKSVNSLIMKLSFGQKICLLRMRQNLKMNQVAVVLNVHPTTVSRWEQADFDGKNLPYEKLEKLAEIYDTTVSDLLASQEAA